MASLWGADDRLRLGDGVDDVLFGLRHHAQETILKEGYLDDDRMGREEHIG